MKIAIHRSQYGPLAGLYSKFRKPYEDSIFKFLASLITSKRIIILDIACGTGKSTEPLTKLNANVYGIDHDILMIREAVKQANKKNLSIKYINDSVENLSFDDNSVDVVTVGTAFHWFENKQAMAQINRVIVHQGLLYVYWTMPKNKKINNDSIPVQIPEYIINKYDWEFIPKKLKNVDFVKEFLIENKYQNVSVKLIPFTQQYTINELLGRLKTASSYGYLSSSNKINFIEDMHKYLLKMFKGKKYIDTDEVVHICYGFKILQNT